jgi:diaminopimelate decarboxylase
MVSSKSLLEKTAEVLRQSIPVLEYQELVAYVRAFLERADSYLDTYRKHGSPLYVLDEKVLLERAEQFATAFKTINGDPGIFYAVKSNNHPAVVDSLVKFGLGLDVSSGLELELALDSGCANIIFSGPGKTEAELRLAVSHHDRVTILVDSFGELDRLEKIASQQKVRVRAGVRLTTDDGGLWRKFGIPLDSLGKFLEKAEDCSHVDLCGLQFHTSWNLDPNPQVTFISRLGKSLENLQERWRTALKFIDIGGGYWPPRGEWLQLAGTPKGRLRQAVLPITSPTNQHYKLYAESIETFAQEIGEALQSYIFPYLDCRIYTEPGRWLCNDAMHILMTVVDKKADDIVIADAGTNIIGWERFETEYFPVINLSRPSESERECLIFGSLCTPHDIWGYNYFGDGIEPGDILMIPSQGAYTYSLRQEFIKPLAKVVRLELTG